MTALALAAGALAIAGLVPATILLAQVCAASLGARERSGPHRGVRPDVVVLVPAHDEATVIAATLRALLPQLAARDRLLVVADNCSDDTAELARREGAAVLERRNLQLRGKIHALEFGLRALQADPPAVVIVVDADCVVEADCIGTLARECGRTQRPVQGRNLMRAPPGAPLRTRIAAFAWILKNWIRPLGMRRLGLPCVLTGTGMAIPWNLTNRLYGTGAAIAEDYKASIDMALAGAPAVFCPHAGTHSAFPVKRTALSSQRTRWEHGHLDLILRAVPRLLLAAARRRDPGLFGLALELAVPPLALVALVVAAALLLGVLAAYFSATTRPLGIAAAAAGALCASVAIAWTGWGRGTLSFASLALAPLYALSKIPLYARFLTRRQKDWVKTERD